MFYSRPWIVREKFLLSRFPPTPDPKMGRIARGSESPRDGLKGSTSVKFSSLWIKGQSVSVYLTVVSTRSFIEPLSDIDSNCQ